MKCRYLFIYILVLLSGIFYARFYQQDREVKSAVFSPVSANPKNLIDINKLTPADYEHIIEKLNVVFVLTSDSQKQVYFNDEEIHSLTLSPSKEQVAFTYYPDELGDQGLSLILLDLGDKKTKEIFSTKFPSWDITSGIQWLGEDHLIFLRHCGTSCQGMSLLNIRTGKVKNATISYQSFPDQAPFTHFEDWVGRTYRMEGFANYIKSKQVDNKSYLVFALEDAVGKKLSEEAIEFLPTTY